MGLETGYFISFMTLHQLRVFLTVAKLGSFTEAARALHVVQPSVSAMVQELENELEIELFQRFGNKFRLTTVGEMVLRDAQEIVSLADGLKDKVDEVRGLKKGRLRVGGSSTAAASFLPGAAQSFKKKYSGIDVILTIHRSNVLEKKLLEGDLDLAILGWPSRYSMLASEPYREEEIVVIAPPNHPLTKKRSVPLELLSKEPLVIQERGSNIRDGVEKSFAEKRLPFMPVLEVDIQFGGRDTMKNAVANGIGIGFLFKSLVVADIEAGRLKVLKVPELHLKRTLYITVHRGRQSSSLVHAFIDFLKSHQGIPR